MLKAQIKHLILYKFNAETHMEPFLFHYFHKIKIQN